VKKRVKENTPPGEKPTPTTEWVSMGNTSSVHHSNRHHRTNHNVTENVTREPVDQQREPILIADSPGPISVITISSDSEEDDSQDCHSPKKYVNNIAHYATALKSA
jgi:hypothetical protein